MYSVGCFSSVCVGGCVFPAFVIQHLLVCTMPHYKKCTVYAVAPVYVWVVVCFPALVIQNLWVCTDIYNVYSSLAARNVQHRLLQQYMSGGAVCFLPS